MNEHPYRGVSAAFPTKHQKEKIVSPKFSTLDIELIVSKIDTDLLGTFSGEIPRSGTPKEVVLKKAHLGAIDLGLPFAIASEGSIAPDPLIPFLISDIECMAWIDKNKNIEVVEFYRSLDIVTARTIITKSDSIQQFLTKADFPNHSLIAKSENGSGQIFKGLNSVVSLEIALKKLWKDSEKLIIESDLRAHHSPSRRQNIAVLAERLVTRLSKLCPKCQLPGWGHVGDLYGVECRECGIVEKQAIRGMVLGCAGCEYKEEKLSERSYVEPAECSFCNP